MCLMKEALAVCVIVTGLVGLVLGSTVVSLAVI